jgi:glycosyltransferase involved in cell wall biosynthesis
VVDQLIGGSFGFTATEAMAVGAPVIAYLRPGVAISAPDECPIINASSSTIKTVLAELMGERKRLERAAREGPTYVRKYLSIQSLSADLRRLYQAHGILIPQPLQAK